VEHHALLEKFYSVLMNHQYRLQDQNQVLEDVHQAHAAKMPACGKTLFKRDGSFCLCWRTSHLTQQNKE
jgi:hypothetical protein